MGKSHTLTQKQQRFVLEYLQDGNGKRAAIAAGYAEKSAEVTASKMLRIAKVQAELERRKTAQYKRLEVSADVIKRELLRIATSDLARAFDVNGRLLPFREIPKTLRRSISAIKVKSFTEPGGGEEPIQVWTTEIKLWDKPKSLELLGKHLKLFTDVVEHQGKLTLEQLLTQSQKSEADE